jgi:TfoX/Sxy family transcriptional regulator of competence genes
MAFDETLAERIRERLGTRPDVEERRMFGGIGFLVAGNMCCGVHRDELIVRLDRDAGAALLASEPGVRPFDITGRAMSGWLLVAPEAVADGDELDRWIGRAEEFAAALPPKR